MNRRRFAKAMAAGAGALGAAALLPAPQAMGAAESGDASENRRRDAGGTPAESAQQAEAAQSGPKLKLTKEQEERVAFNVARNERQVAALRARTLPYDAEPAFAFRVRAVKREPRRIRMGS